MNWLKALLAGAAVGVILIAFRDFENERWLAPAGAGGGAGTEGAAGTEEEEEVEEEPLLGYDGMDEETLILWLSDARLDRRTLTRIRRYEEENLAREAVLEAVDGLL
jgi:hypothetical protein